jgi:hypothetical protein
MHALLRLSLWAAAASLFATLGGLCVSIRGNTLAHDTAALLAECEQASALEARVAAQHSRQEEMKAVGAELIAGRLRLAEAAEALYRLEVTSQGDFHTIRHVFRGQSDEEAAYLYALSWARRQLRGDPCWAATVLARLEAEFEGRFHHPFSTSP